MIYSTAPTSGFNRRLTAGGPNYFYGGAETALGELVRGGAMVLRMVVWHDPGCLAHLTAREAAGGERAHRGEGRVMPHSDSCCASRVLCRLPRQRSARGEAIVDMVLSMLLEFRIFVL